MRLSALLLAWCAYAQQTTPDAIVDFEVQLAPGEPIETFAVHVYRKWAPLGASRFLKLVDDGHFAGITITRRGEQQTHNGGRSVAQFRERRGKHQ